MNRTVGKNLYAILIASILGLQTLIVLTASDQIYQMTSLLPITFGPLLLLNRSDTHPLMFVELAILPLTLLTAPLLPSRFLLTPPFPQNIMLATIGAFMWCFIGMLVMGIDC
ncbi:hypothetical protein [Lacunimicrobium album]